MSYITRCLLSTTTARRASGIEACKEMFQRFSDKPISVRKQLLDANQLHLLSITLSRSPTSHVPPSNGTPIPPGYHLVYFTPSILEKELGTDGTDQTVNPLAPFTRRMWAGGEIQWNQNPKECLRVGQMVQETTRIKTAESKQLSKSGNEMLVIGVEKIFENEQGIALIDKRNWVFQEVITGAVTAPLRPEMRPLPNGKHFRDFCQTDVTLFRFSALTFNGHKIHYSPEWCREVEGHRANVVHGPLSLINILDLWRDTMGERDVEMIPKSITYRALSPLYVDEQYRILLEENQANHEGSEWKAEVWDSFGKVGMKGTISI